MDIYLIIAHGEPLHIFGAFSTEETANDKLSIIAKRDRIPIAVLDIYKLKVDKLLEKFEIEISCW